jgi:hypothetical protein
VKEVRPWKRHWRSREFVLSAVDTVAFSRRFRERYPEVRYVDQSYFKDCDQPNAPPWPKENLQLRYFDVMSDRWRGYYAWIEPDGWRPEWRLLDSKYGKDRLDVYGLRNLPRVNLVFQTCRGVDGSDWGILDGRVTAHVAEGDTEHRLFIDRAIRLLDRMTTNVADLVDEVTGELQVASSRSPRIGPDAMAWCAADPGRRLAGRFRPCGSPGSLRADLAASGRSAEDYLNFPG